MAKLPGAYEYMATVGAPAINFGRGLLGYQDPFMTQTMQDRMTELEAEKGPTGSIGYEDYGLPVSTPGGRFTGGLMGLALNNPVDFGLAGSVGRYGFSPEGRTGLEYNFTPDQDTGSTGSTMLDFINAGGLKGAISKMGTAQASEVTPQTEPMNIEDFLGTSTPQNFGFIEDAPQVKEVIYQDRIMNPNLPGFAYQPKESLRNIIGSQLQNAKTKAGQGFDFAKQIPGMVLSAATGIPFAGQIAQGIGGLLGSVFKESPEQKNFRENIATDPEYQNLVSQIPGMSNYNQIFAMGSGRGLMGAIDKRLATLARTEKRQGVNFSDTLKERRKKLEALREIERQKESAFLESQRRGRRPGTGGDGGGGTQDSGGPTGGYSYDSGGRQGFGYGLKDGGLASMFTRRG